MIQYNQKRENPYLDQNMVLSFGGRERDWGSSVEWLMCQILTHTPNQHSPFPNGIKGYRKKETPPFF